MSALPKDSKAWSGKQRLSGMPALALLVSLVSLLVGGLAGGSKWPPSSEQAHTWAFLACGSAIVVALAASRFNPSSLDRAVCGIAVLLALFALWTPLCGYQGSYHDYPWTILGAAILVLVVGGTLSGQRWLAVAVPAFLAFWFYGGVLPADTNVPRSIASGDLRCTLLSIGGEQHRSCEFRLEGPSGIDLAKVYDLDHIRLSGGVGLLVPVACWQAIKLQPAGSADRRSPPNRADFRSTIFLPAWSRSWDLKIVVPWRPRQPELKVVFPIPPLRQKSTPAGVFTATVEKARLTVSDAHWTDVGLSLLIYGDGISDKTLRATDNFGRPVPIHGRSFRWRKKGFETRCTLLPDRLAKRIRIEGFSEAQASELERVFEFRRVPTAVTMKTPDLKVSRPDWMSDETPQR